MESHAQRWPFKAKSMPIHRGRGHTCTIKPEGNESRAMLARHCRGYDVVADGKGAYMGGGGRKRSACEIVPSFGQWNIRGEGRIVSGLKTGLKAHDLDLFQNVCGRAFEREPGQWLVPKGDRHIMVLHLPGKKRKSISHPHPTLTCQRFPKRTSFVTCRADPQEIARQTSGRRHSRTLCCGGRPPVRVAWHAARRITRTDRKSGDDDGCFEKVKWNLREES